MPLFAIVIRCSDLTPAAAEDAIGRLERAGQLINLHGTVLLRPGEVAEALNLVGCPQQTWLQRTHLMLRAGCRWQGCPAAAMWACCAEARWFAVLAI